MRRSGLSPFGRVATRLAVLFVAPYKGRIYLAKDVRVSKETFEKGYPQIDTFRQFRKANKMDETFQSLQSKRVGI